MTAEWLQAAFQQVLLKESLKVWPNRFVVTTFFLILRSLLQSLSFLLLVGELILDKEGEFILDGFEGTEDQD